MKALKIYKPLLIVLSCLALTAAAYSQEKPDTYETEETAVSKEKKDIPYQNKNLKSKATNIILGDTPIELGEGTLFEYNITGTKINQNAVTYYYYPKAKSIVLKISSYLANSFVFLDKEACAKMKKSFNQYLNDFEAHTLSSKAKNSYTSYGYFQSTYKQGLIGTGTVTKPKTTVGYRFIKKSPYFCFTLWPAEAEAFIQGVDVDPGEGSPKMTFFMTKKQGNTMLEYIDESVFEQMDEQFQLNQEKLESSDEYDEY